MYFRGLINEKVQLFKGVFLTCVVAFIDVVLASGFRVDVEFWSPSFF